MAMSSVAVSVGSDDAKGGANNEKMGSDNIISSNNQSPLQSIQINTETIRLYLMSVIHRLGERITLDTLRPLPLFLGITGPTFCLSAEAFSPPARHVDKTFVEKVHARVALNFAYFLSNYALVAFGVAVVVALLHPGMLIVLGMVYGLWSFHDYLIENEVIVFGRNVGTLLTISQRSTLVLLVTAYATIMYCFLPVLSFLGVSSCLIIFHAVMRDPTHIERYSPGLLDEEDEDDDSSGEEVLVDRRDVL